MLAGLSTGHEIGLGLSGLAFVVFALISAMLIPRRQPDFPGDRRNVFLAVTFAFFIGMLAAVVVFGRGSEREKPKKEKPAAAAPYLRGEASSSRAEPG